MCKTRLALCRWKRSISKQLQPARRRCNPVLMFLVRCVVASISYIIVIAAWRAGRSQWPIQKIVLQLDSLGYRVVLFRVILRLDGHRAMASNKCIAVRKVATWDRAGSRVGECEACARCTSGHSMQCSLSLRSRLRCVCACVSAHAALHHHLALSHSLTSLTHRHQ